MNGNNNILPDDYHIHTVLCNHASGHISEYLKHAHKLELREICFTDHIPSSDGYDIKNRMDIDQFPEYIKMVSTLSSYNQPTVLFGIEADYYEGCQPFIKEWIPSKDFDFVIGSVHYIGDWGFDNPDNRKIWDSVDVTNTWRKYFKIIEKLAKTNIFDVIAHLDLPKKFGHRPKDKDLKEMAQPALDTIARAGMGIEINTSGLRRPVKEIYPSPLLLKLACEREIPVCFGSDSHCPEDVGYAFNKALKLAKQAGYTNRLSFRKRKRKLVPLPDIIKNHKTSMNS